MSKLKTVIRHEYLTIIKQPSFWIVMLAIPLMVGAALLLSYNSNKSSSTRIEELARELKNVALVDESGLINKDVVKANGLSLSPPNAVASLREDVRTGKKEALVVFPADLAHEKVVRVYLNNNDLTKMSAVNSLAENLLKTSLFLPLGSPDIIALAQHGSETQVVTYKNGRETAGINEYVVPGLFVVLFYIIFMFSVGYMLTSVSEEKENRSVEMVLTYVNAHHLIIGKLLAVILVTLTQIVFFALLTAAGLMIAQWLGESLSLPAGIDLNRLVFNPTAILFGAGFLAAGFLMFAGFMTTTAAAAPSTREASSFSSVFYLGVFAPFYFFSMLLTDPENPLTKFLTFFPLTSPVTTLLRNTVGNMDLAEASLALIVMCVFTTLSLAIAVRAFQNGALEYTSKLRLRTLFGRK